MSSRNYLSPSELNLPPHHNRPVVDHRAAAIDDRIAAQHHDIQTLLHDNQRLAAAHVALKQDLAVADQELRRAATAAQKATFGGDAQVREVYERSAKAEAEARVVEGMGKELEQVREDVKVMREERKELVDKLREVEAQGVKVRAEVKEFLEVKADIEAMHVEIQRGRAAIEYEKKVQTSNHEQSQAMEKNLISMAHEIEKLQAELANAEKRARAAAAAAAAVTPSPATGYAVGYGNPDMGYGGNTYHDPYAVHQVQGAVDGGPQYGPGAVPHSTYDMQRQHLHR